MKKEYVDVTIRLTINAKEGIDIHEVISEMDYKFTSNTEGAEIVDTDIEEYDITYIKEEGGE
jgi:hypothetical protein